MMTEARLTSAEYAQKMKAELKDSGMLIVDDEAAEEKLVEFRSTYEPFLIRLADYLLLTLPSVVALPECWITGKIGRVAGPQNV